ncbi:MAG TPA: P-loop NTPase, partial [Candidatus Ozemobacteraceae bacterium]|nr:P-loop NTPase [Candidatus Ozemobacteraceae bacterium]
FIEHKIFRSIQASIVFSCMDELDEFVLWLAERIKRPVTVRNPIVDAVLPDGSRINIVYGRDIAKRGSNFTIRKFAEEPLSIVQTVGKADGAIIVTTPQQVATADVRRSISFCHRLDLPVLGVIENMSGFVCPHCNETTEIFSKGGGETMAADMGVPFLGRIPIDPELMGAGDRGVPYVQRFSERPAAKAFSKAILPLIGRMGDTVAGQEEA